MLCHTGTSLCCPLHPSKSHLPFKAQGVSLGSTFLTLQGSDSPLSSSITTLYLCHYFTDGADGLKCRLCTGTLCMILIHELHTEPVLRNVPTSLSPLTLTLHSNPTVTLWPHLERPTLTSGSFFFSSSPTHLLPLNLLRRKASGYLMPVIIK